jgi:hypothetical protein
MENAMLGSCALCKKQADLQRSHFLPAGLFKAVIQGRAPYDDAPVMIDVPRGTAVQVNFQSRTHSLCRSCEQLFSTNGESIVIAACHRKDGEFLLRDRLEKLPPSRMSKSRRVFFGHELPQECAASAWYYFALSVFWRASAVSWPGETGVVPGALGEVYEEAIRTYLLGATPPPKGISLHISVYFDAEPTTFLTFPTHRKVEVQGRRFVEHTFIIPGCNIKLWVGNAVAEFEETLGSRPGYPTFFETMFHGSDLHRRVAMDVQAAVSRGKLAKEN